MVSEWLVPQLQQAGMEDSGLEEDLQMIKLLLPGLHDVPTSQHLIILSEVMMLYFVPAFLYCLYNNLAFVNLSAFDPTTYYLLLQFRVVVTGIVFQVSSGMTVVDKHSTRETVENCIECKYLVQEMFMMINGEVSVKYQLEEHVFRESLLQTPLLSSTNSTWTHWDFVFSMKSDVLQCARITLDPKNAGESKPVERKLARGILWFLWKTMRLKVHLNISVSMVSRVM
ncbi:hypothetical protein ANN_09126 [Periplaneta americana]|uniref:Uncharacterized protein n=1 Tax=Periplaneta americana TaxID=6978 RepID=A0ABQ8TMW2_PERAM|nr:hypothetical protein ANN_09126 [Periplaneta americana]